MLKHFYKSKANMQKKQLFYQKLTLNVNYVIVLSRYILSIERAEEIEEYVGDLLQGTDGRKGQFIDDLLCRWKKTQKQSIDNTSVFLYKESVSSAGRPTNV